MNTAEKLFAAMSAHPQNWHLRDLQTVAKRHGICWRQTGSHCTFSRPDGTTLPVPAHRTIKPVYVRQFVAFVKGTRYEQPG